MARPDKSELQLPARREVRVVDAGEVRLVPLEEDWSEAADELRERTMSLEEGPFHVPGWMFAIAAFIATLAIALALFFSRGSLRWIVGA